MGERASRGGEETSAVPRVIEWSGFELLASPTPRLPLKTPSAGAQPTPRRSADGCEEDGYGYGYGYGYGHEHEHGHEHGHEHATRPTRSYRSASCSSVGSRSVGLTGVGPCRS